MKYFIYSFIFFSQINVFAQGFHYKFKIHGLKDSIAILGNYYGDQQYAKDTSKVSKTGEFEFKDTTLLENGLYFIYFPTKTYFEFIVYNENNFFIETEYGDMLDKMRVTGSPQNEEFLKFQKYMILRQKEQNDLIKLRDSIKKTDEKRYKELDEKVKKLGDDMLAFSDKVIEKRDKYFIGKMMYAQKDIVIPEKFRNLKTKQDSLDNYTYYRTHYYDHIDFDDYAISNTPILSQRNKQFFDKIITQEPDTIAREAVNLCKRAQHNKIMFKNLVSTLTDKFNQSKIMGMDKVFVTMVDTFFETGKVTWLDKARMFRIKNRARELRPCLIGKQAYPLTLKDDNGVMQDLYKVQAKYTVLMFWDPDCGHCKQELPHVISFYETYKPKGAEIYAVTTETDFPKWSASIKEHKMKFINVYDPNDESKFREYYDVFSTPVFYILDANKRIIAKRLAAEQLADFIQKYEKLNNIK